MSHNLTQEELNEMRDWSAKAEQLVRLGMMPVAKLPYIKRALKLVAQDAFLPLIIRKPFYEFIDELLELGLGEAGIYRLIRNKVAANRNDSITNRYMGLEEGNKESKVKKNAHETSVGSSFSASNDFHVPSSKKRLGRWVQQRSNGPESGVSLYREIKAIEGEKNARGYLKTRIKSLRLRKEDTDMAEQESIEEGKTFKDQGGKRNREYGSKRLAGWVKAGKFSKKLAAHKDRQNAKKEIANEEVGTVPQQPKWLKGKKLERSNPYEDKDSVRNKTKTGDMVRTLSQDVEIHEDCKETDIKSGTVKQQPKWLKGTKLTRSNPYEDEESKHNKTKSKEIADKANSNVKVTEGKDNQYRYDMESGKHVKMTKKESIKRKKEFQKALWKKKEDAIGEETISELKDSTMKSAEEKRYARADAKTDSSAKRFELDRAKRTGITRAYRHFGMNPDKQTTMPKPTSEDMPKGKAKQLKLDMSMVLDGQVLDEDVNYRKTPQGMLQTLSNMVKIKKRHGGKVSVNDRKIASKARNELRRRKYFGAGTTNGVVTSGFEPAYLDLADILAEENVILTEEQLDELKKVLGSYLKKATADYDKRFDDEAVKNYKRGKGFKVDRDEIDPDSARKLDNREKGIETAKAKIKAHVMGEEVIDELHKDTYKNYLAHALTDRDDHLLNYAAHSMFKRDEHAHKSLKQVEKRTKGISHAITRLHNPITKTIKDRPKAVKHSKTSWFKDADDALNTSDVDTHKRVRKEDFEARFTKTLELFEVKNISELDEEMTKLFMNLVQNESGRPEDLYRAEMDKRKEKIEAEYAKKEKTLSDVKDMLDAEHVAKMEKKTAIKKKLGI